MASIWIIDDKPGRGYSLALVLQQANHQARVIERPACAFDLLEQEPPALILLSDDLPPCARGHPCRYLKTVSTVPVLLYSSELRLCNAAYVQALGADYALSYPFSGQYLLEHVTHVLQSLPQVG